MKKAIICFLLVVSLLLCACAEEEGNNAELKSALESAISATNSEEAFSGQYMLEISFGKGVALYYALGDVECDRSAKKAFVSFSQTYLGISSGAKNYIESGKIISVEGETATEIEGNTEGFLAKFPYGAVFPLPENASLTTNETMVGTTYTVIRNDTKSICENVVGDDIYEMVDVLKQPQKDKTEYSETECTYTVSEGRVTGVRYEFDMKLFDTPAYIPGYSMPESEYTVQFHVVAKISYNEFGSGVEVEEYVGGESEISS